MLCVNEYERNHEIALDIISQGKAEYYDMFCELKKEIDEKWI